MNPPLLLPAVVLAALSGLPALWRPARGPAGSWVATGCFLLAATLGAAAAVATLARGVGETLRVPAGALLPELSFALDPLAAVFVLPVCFVCSCAAIYDVAYWRGARRGHSGSVRLFLGLLFASLLALLAAADAIAFLISWEVMALSAFFLVSTEHEKPEARGAGWVYLAATHAGTLLLIAFFCLWNGASGGLALSPLAATVPQGTRDALFALALAGFGLKAGIVPLHFWLPPAHANAPSHVSAVMSGVLIKMGVYGVARTLCLLPAPPVAWGVIVLAIGAVSAVAGVAFAIGQHDLKRLLAYHSIENIGIIFLGLGVAVLGRATGSPELAALGLAGALLHVWNHGLFKALLFLAAGASIRACGGREIDRLGGLAHRMPATAACFLVGAVAICGLPPLNGFVSELLVWLGLFRSLGAAPAAAAAAMAAIPALALVGAMALLCFVKVFGVVYLGAPRTAAAAAAHEAPAGLRAPMWALAAACLAIGLLPALALPALAPAVAAWLPVGRVPELAALLPCASISGASTGLVGAALLCWWWLARGRDARAPAPGTWDCGYVLTTPRMQYTASSFAQHFVDMTRLLLLPRTHRPDTATLFPSVAHFRSHVPDLVLERALLPVLRGLAATCDWLRGLQRGRVQVYLLYVFLTLLCLLLLT